MRTSLIGMVLGLLLASVAWAASPYQMSYSGRLTDGVGKPVAGPVELEVSFHSAANAGTLLYGPVAYQDVPVSDGMFVLNFAFDADEYHQIFGGVAETYVQIKDVAANRVYTRQLFGAVPYALKVPVDPLTMSYDSLGKLGLNVVTAPTAGNDGQILKWTTRQRSSSGVTMSSPED